MIYDPLELQKIGELIRTKRADRPQSWLAEQVHTKTSAISYIEKGNRPVPKNKVQDFARALGVDPNQLIPSKMAVDEVRKEMKELEDMGFAFRALQALPDEAKKELVDFYNKLKGQYLSGDIPVQKAPEEIAMQVLDECGIKKGPVDLNKILKKYHINVESSTTISADGVIVYSKGQKWAGIKYREGMSDGRIRFTIAHELGHFFLKNTDDAEISCSLDGQNKGKENERQADNFASNLLMPRKWVADVIRDGIEGIEDILRISHQFEVSQQAAAIRLAQLSNKPCAVVCSKNGKIDWWYTSPKLYVRAEKGRKLFGATQASKLLRGKVKSTDPVKTKSERWFSSRVPGIFMEHSTLLYKDTVLSLLWAKS